MVQVGGKRKKRSNAGKKKEMHPHIKKRAQLAKKLYEEMKAKNPDAKFSDVLKNPVLKQRYEEYKKSDEGKKAQNAWDKSRK